MNIGSFVWAGVLIASLVLAGCQEERASSEGAGDAPIRVGAAAPDFALPAAGGGRVSLSEHRGEAVLLYFSMGPG